MRLVQLEELFWQAVRRDFCPTAVDSEFVASRALSARERLGIYRRMYWSRQINALRDSFPRLAAVLGEEGFTSLGCAYVAAHPSEHPTLERLGRRLSEFLSEEPTSDRYLAHLALLEWARSEAFLAPNAPVVARFEDVLPSSFARARLVFVPSLSAVLVDVRAVALWDDPRALRTSALEATIADAAHSLTTEIETVPSAAVRVAVWRRNFDVLHAALGTDESNALGAALSGAPMAEVCSAFEGHVDGVQRALAALSRWLRRGWVARIDYREPSSELLGRA